MKRPGRCGNRLLNIFDDRYEKTVSDRDWDEK
jgi:hypothetical protein